jgi:DNA-binding PadR family transcriptional regulator
MVSKISTLVLGLLAEGERHGYELIKEMDERGMLRWTHVSKVAVYKALARLEEEGCLTSWTEKAGNLPEKRIYAITAMGEERLRDLVYSICASREPLRSDTSVGLAFISRLNAMEARSALEARLDFLKAELERLRKEGDILKGLTDDIFMDILDREISAYREEVRWLSGIISRMDGGGSSSRKGRSKAATARGRKK